MNQLEQGSPEWLAWRRGGIGGSDAPVIMGVSPWMTLMDLYLDKIGEREPQPVNEAMQRGTDLEPVARAAYEAASGNIVAPMLCQHQEHPWLIASLDGLSFDGALAVEIKCPGRSSHNEAKEGRVPEVYWPQVQHILLASGAERLDYWSFDGSEGVLIPVEPDEAYQLRLLEAEIVFWECVTSRVPPKQTTYEGRWECKDAALLAVASSYLLAADALEKQKRDCDRLKSKLTAAARSAINVIGPVVVKRMKGRVSIDQKALEAGGIDLNGYRKPGADYWQVERSK